MGQLFDTIRQLVAEEKYVIGQHASERLDERGIMEWQAVAGLEDGELIAERPDAMPTRRLRCASPCRTAPSSRPSGLTYVRVVSPSW